MREVAVGQVAAAGSGEGGRRGLGRQTALRGRSGRLERRRAPLSGIWGRAAPENADLGENFIRNTSIFGAWNTAYSMEYVEYGWNTAEYRPLGGHLEYVENVFRQ